MAMPNNTPALVVDANVAIAVTARETGRDALAVAELSLYGSQGYEWYAPGAIVAETLYILCQKYQAMLLTTAEYENAAAAGRSVPGTAGAGFRKRLWMQPLCRLHLHRPRRAASVDTPRRSRDIRQSTVSSGIAFGPNRQRQTVIARQAAFLPRRLPPRRPLWSLATIVSARANSAPLYLTETP
jgi:hypothetical protein